MECFTTNNYYEQTYEQHHQPLYDTNYAYDQSYAELENDQELWSQNYGEHLQSPNSSIKSKIFLTVLDTQN